MRSRGKRRGQATGKRAPAPEPRSGPRPGPAAAETDAEHVARLYGRIYEVARGIPRGRVVTYGQVAELAGMPGAARVVGAAMRASLPALGVPWQRVVGKRSRGVGKVSIQDPVGGAVQRAMLEDEGVVFSASGGISLSEYGWVPEDPPRRDRARAASKTARPKARRRGPRR